MSVAIFISFAWRTISGSIGGFVLGIGAMLPRATRLTWNEGYLPAVPALQSYWIKVHVPLVVSSYAAFLVAAASSVCFCSCRYYAERRCSSVHRRVAAACDGAAGDAGRAVAPDLPPHEAVTVDRDIAAATGRRGSRRARQRGRGLAASLPSLAKLDIMTYRIIAIGLPLLTVGIITGAMWAKEAWGAYWQWDPKETAALLSWIIYAGYMHLHTRNAWRGERSAWISIVGFISILFCYLGVNIWISGLHSYKM